MKPLSTLLLSFCLAAAVARSGELSGVYVNKKSPHYGIDFLPGGECFFSHAFGDSAGTWAKDKDAFVCKAGDEEKARFRVQDHTLIDQDGEPWVRREEVAQVPWKNVSSVTMVVLDSETRKPITRFSYTYRISTPAATYDPLLVRPQEVRSDSGTFMLSAPRACEIEIKVEGENILGGFSKWKSYNLTSDNKLRRIEVLVATGVTFSGTVTDARTGKPVTSALVSPVFFTPPRLAGSPHARTRRVSVLACPCAGHEKSSRA